MVTSMSILRSAVSVKVAGDCTTAAVVCARSAASAAIETAVAIQPMIGVAFLAAASENLAMIQAERAGDAVMAAITRLLASASHIPLSPLRSESAAADSLNIS